MTVLDVGRTATGVVVTDEQRSGSSLRAAGPVASGLAAAVATAASLLLPVAGDLRVLGVVVTGLFPVAWLAALAVQGAYRPTALDPAGGYLAPLRDAALRLAALLAMVGFWFHASTALIWAAVTVPLAFALEAGARALLVRRVRQQWVAGEGLRRVVVVGTDEAVGRLVPRLSDASGTRVVGACLPEAGQRPALIARQIPVVGGLDNVARAVELTRADTVLVAGLGTAGLPDLRRLAWDLEDTGATVELALDVDQSTGARLGLRRSGRTTTVAVAPRTESGLAVAMKAAVDRLAAGVGLLLLAPMLLVVVVAIRLDSPGPVVFRQLRTGRGGRVFTMLKFRTMVVDAPALQADLDGDDDNGGVMFKMRRDPRVTRVGRVLRRFSVDELPQLVNVLRGDMSLVGPRPHPTYEAEQYTGDAHRRLLAKPGLTGWWQVSGRSDLSWEESLELDLRYVDEWSLALDGKLLWRTGRAVLKGTGAY